MYKVKGSFFYLLIVIFAIPGFCSGQQNSDNKLSITGKSSNELSSFDETVLEILQMTDAPGAALAVGRHEKLVFARGYGLADTKRNVPVQPDSRFRIASVSKPITAVAILKLVEQGNLSLDDRITDLLKYEKDTLDISDKRINEISVRNLLYHTGGWDREQSGFDPPFAVDRIAIALGKDPPASAEMVVHFMLTQPLDFNPGFRQSYSNLGYAILGRIIEFITGKSYEKYVKRNIFEPIGAKGFVMGRSLLSDRFQDEVRYHDPRRFFSVYPNRGIVPAPYGAFSIETMDAHGGWVARAPDLVRFMSALDGDKTIPDILEKQTIKKMVSPYSQINSDSTYYAMGWYVLSQENKTVWYHMGDLPGTTAFILRDGNVSVALLLNGNAGSRENANKLLPLLQNAILEVDKWPDKDLFPQF